MKLIQKCFVSLIALNIATYSNAEMSEEAKKTMSLIKEEDWQEMFYISNSIAASCTEKIWSDWSDLMNGVRAIVQEIVMGAAQVGSEYATGLKFKKDYPNACHVMTKEHLENISKDSYTKNPCIVHKPAALGGGCLVRERRTYSEFSYYWPKYFIEVSEKGNDPLPAFAENNTFYSANRKIANKLDSFMDVKGPFTMAAKVAGSSRMLRKITEATTGHGFKFDSDGNEIKQSAETAILTPFEKLRIRANKEATQPSYEVNIWPVALSKSMAENFAICGDGKSSTDNGGFSWPMQGVAMTCPVAMARDAWPYWDSGFIDYLNPNAVRGIATATNPMSCIADNLASAAFDQYGGKGFTSSMGDQGKKDGALSGMSSAFDGLRSCSFPIMGDSEAIYKQYAGLLDSFKGPWCTMWGSMTPRNSTASFQNDYSFVNSALKFKTLAHDIFGIPRGNKERWALAYPWEDSVESSATNGLNMGDFLNGLREKLPAGVDSALFNSNTGRSHMLAVVGDPRMIDFSFNLGVDTKNLAREIVYMASLSTTASASEREAVRQLGRVNGVLNSTSQQILNQHRQDVNRTDEETAPEGEEDVYEKRNFCHVYSMGIGLVYGSEENKFNVKYNDLVFKDWFFAPISSMADCYAVSNVGGCLTGYVNDVCMYKRPVTMSFYEKMVKTGTKKVKNPRLFKLDQTCSYKSQTTFETATSYYTCKDKLVVTGRQETPRQEQPDPNNVASLVGKDKDLQNIVKEAAKIAPWVGAELARAKYEEMAGKSLLPGKKRVYTIFEEVTCRPDGYVVNIGPITKYGECKEAIRIEIKKYIQTKLLRRICDSVFDSKLGKPFK